METWLTSLSKHDLNAWIKTMSSGVNLFLAAPEDKKNLEIARQILKTRNKKVGEK